MQRGEWVAEEGLLTASVQLAGAYEALAKKLSVGFIDASGWEIEMAFDGVHFSEAGSKAFGLKCLAFI